ncbi:exopolyphosphatase [Ramlibacter solisilvae]|uniref:Exopolyphosphatase n=1 Tax=Ramlibacter tataouinensis TaxID=94132 RepID=A0A127JNX4_9BURK|nr:exopolyphosphatase [Ramlibacter tataouinensis]AMO21645.1 exopolyphosphatase [Ramlibacter tataouinensis]
MQNGSLLAAVDLGSNSFRLEIGRLEHGQIRRTEYIKETVRQGSGLDASRNLTQEAMQRGWDCLARFAERLAGFRRSQVRAVATQTLREARNRDAFLAQAHRTLGFPIDVISGTEEARLIYQGVAHLLPQSDEQRLVVDIGGRSTELILGQHVDANLMASYRVGSVAWSMRYFPQGALTHEAFDEAELAAQAVLEEALDAYERDRWEVAYGSSGTIGAVADIVAAAGGPAGLITREDLDRLRAELVASGHVDKVRLPSLKDDRRPVIGGGLSVLRAVFDTLQIDSMQAAQGALRHGVLYDMLDREQPVTDMRSTTVKRLCAKFDADAAQAARVAAAACTLLRQLRHADDDQVLARHERKLSWAAQLHEIGSTVSHSDYHKHGAYILDNTDAPGFAAHELHRLGQLVLGHRGKLRKLDIDFGDEPFVHQLACIRLAVILCHARRDPELRGLQLSGGDRSMTLKLPAAWSAKHPQSAWLLREEAAAWQKTPWAFELG